MMLNRSKACEHFWSTKDYGKSLKWYERCVERYTACSANMGLAFENGYGVTQDYRKLSTGTLNRPKRGMVMPQET